MRSKYFYGGEVVFNSSALQYGIVISASFAVKEKITFLWICLTQS